jgi:transmembrane sensor
MKPDDEPTEVQREEAALWFARKSGGSLPPDCANDLEAWLNADVKHRRAYDDIRVLYAQLEAPARLAHGNAPIGDRIVKRLRPRWSWLFAPSALLLALVLARLADPAIIQDWRADIVTSNDLVSVLTLPDGSIANLGADTAVALDFKDGHRLVRLLRGEAYFEVRHGAAGLFTVEVDGARIQDAGTKFNVELIRDQTEVAVVEGAVEVAGSVETEGVLLRRGDEALVKGGRVGHPRAVDLSAALAWMKGRLVVQGARVDDVVSILQRHTRAKIILLDGLGQREISGTFTLTDVADSLATIAAAVQGSIVQAAPLATALY